MEKRHGCFQVKYVAGSGVAAALYLRHDVLYGTLVFEQLPSSDFSAGR